MMKAYLAAMAAMALNKKGGSWLSWMRFRISVSSTMWKGLLWKRLK
jgi:hypothetical protein